MLNWCITGTGILSNLVGYGGARAPSAPTPFMATSVSYWQLVGQLSHSPVSTCLYVCRFSCLLHAGASPWKLWGAYFLEWLLLPLWWVDLASGMCILQEKVKVMCTVDLSRKPLAELQSVTCHSYHPTQVNASGFNSRQTGWYSIYLRLKDGRLSWL